MTIGMIVASIFALALVVALPALTANGSQNTASLNSLIIVLTLSGILIATILLSQAARFTRRYLEKVPNDSFVIPFLIFAVIFSFIYLGARGFESMGVVAAIFGGVAVKQVLPEKFVQPVGRPGQVAPPPL